MIGNNTVYGPRVAQSSEEHSKFKCASFAVLAPAVCWIVVALLILQNYIQSLIPRQRRDKVHTLLIILNHL
jgi:hypothetical protein